jgi:hypothetical protein
LDDNGYDGFYGARSLIEDFLRRDLLGPVSDDEVIEDTWPTDYYITGRLFPQGMKIREEELVKSDLEDTEETTDQPMNLCNSAYPSSIAISFTVNPGVEKLHVQAKYAWYIPFEKSETRGESSRYRWHRQSAAADFEIYTESRYQHMEVRHGLELRVYLQKEYGDGSRTMTVALVNTNIRELDMMRNNASSFFQPSITVRGGQEDHAPFIEKKMRVDLQTDPEVLTLEMLYRHNKVFGIGHGCSVGWKSEGDHATELFTEFIPTHELLQMKPAMHVDREILTFKFLGDGAREEVIQKLGLIPASYEQWIREREEEVGSLPERYRTVARRNLDNCRTSLSRIRDGIELLQSNAEIFDSFQFVNRAMLRQRLQYEAQSGWSAHAWYPFQIAFILQEIRSIAYKDDPSRQIVDLLWFPTGGGKTEAYLGLATFTMFLRRIRAVRGGKSGAGVTIIMRYTLRLLTLQQFERASALICACELLRRENPATLGTDEIGIGLWVGGSLTPIKRGEAKKALEIILEKSFEALKQEDLANPCQILTCPWCKADIKPKNYSITGDRMLISCPSEACDFHGGLPVYLIDDDIYELQPSLVLGTIDKFARMTWEKKVGKLFGLRSDLLPPELIIQDELHLISGPLGTIAGLYEVAIDDFCKDHDSGAKIISSTATIRNAENQILSLYGHAFHQFPPPGIDIRDSYFAEEASPGERPSRLYIGLLAPGTSGDTLLIRVYSILLFATRYLKERGFSDEIIDSFWTLTGYFNSLKQLGGTVIRIIDDVSGRLKYLYQTKFGGYFPAGTIPPEGVEFAELTSRKDSSEIGETLKRLQTGYPAQGALDVILASNMLSVGIDIGRLGLMILQGQPKSNSEYIQATSRVGRQSPGLVITMHDASRSRDRSHYEQFLAYHSALYRYVEATSLTPFAERARDRALHAVLISMCRHQIAGLLENQGAENILGCREEAEHQIEKILDRVRRIDSEEIDDTREQLYNILNHWEQLANHGLVYQKYPRSRGFALLTQKFDSTEEAFPTLNSMRNVDVECEVLLEG